MADVILSSFSEKGAVLAALDLVPVLEWNGSTYDNKTILGSRIADTTALALKAPLASPTFTGTVVLPSTTSIGNASNAEISYLDGVTSAIQTQIDNKANSNTASTGSVISFATPIIWNTFGTPSTANLTDDLTSAKIGAIQKIYHNKATEPTYPAGWVKMGTGTYTNSVLNVIFAEWVSGTRVEYWITKPA